MNASEVIRQVQENASKRMQRGIDLDPIARDLFCSTNLHKMIPKVVIKDWAMDSLDGINDCNEILEIKCPGEKDHAVAVSGKVPAHYYPQLQHQMYVCDSPKAFYFSCDDKYKKWVYDYLKKQYKTDNLSNLPADIFQRMKSAAVKNMESNHERQRQVSQQETKLLLQEIQ